MGGATPGGFTALFFGVAPGSFRLSLPFLCVDLGLTLTANPELHILCLGQASPTGEVTCAFTAPHLAQPVTPAFQPVQALTCPDPVQSAVVTATPNRR